MSKLQERNRWTEQIVGAARSTGLIGAVFTTGDGATSSEDLHIVAVTNEGVTAMQAYSRVNYIIMSEFSPASTKAISRDDYCLIKRYDMADGVNVLIKVCSAESIRVEEWYRPVFDRANVTSMLDASRIVSEDVLCDLAAPAPQPVAVAQPEPVVVQPEPVRQPEPEPVRQPEPQPDPFEVIAPEGTGMDPVEEPKAPRVDVLAAAEVATPAASDKGKQDDSEAVYWKFVSDSLRDACDAVADNALIRANEILNLLRRMLIELICVRNGVNENFEREIDKIQCQEKELLAMTFPARHEQRAFLAALGMVSTIFDRLA